MTTELLTALPCMKCGKRHQWEVKSWLETRKNRVIVHVELYCAHCGTRRAEAVLALSEREFTWH